MDPSRRVEKILDSLVPPNSTQADAPSTDRPDLIPFKFQNNLFRSKAGKKLISWLKQKDALGQDMYLLGSGGPLRRWGAQHYAAVAGREVEYVALTRDTTESDLKQRREIVVNQQGKSYSIFVDQSVIAAALNGRILIIEGLENAERNVLPVLNNLLENREMALEDGRFLVAPKRYEMFLREKDKYGTVSERLVKVHRKFRVIAIGIPVPPFPGNPLDPPLRSRFQAFRVDPVQSQTLLEEIARKIAPRINKAAFQKLVGFSESIRAIGAAHASMSGIENSAIAYRHLPYVGEIGIIFASLTIEKFPMLRILDSVKRIYPYEYAVTNTEAMLAVLEVVGTISNGDKAENRRPYLFSHSTHATGTNLGITLRFSHQLDPTVSHPSVPDVVVTVGGGKGSITQPSHGTRGHHEVLSAMLQSHSVARDICVIGPKGSGKTYIVHQFARVLGYTPVETMFLYKDMSARDLLQRRSTSSTGNTIWQNTPLVEAISKGRLAILDGLHRLPPGTLTILFRLIQDREITLFDGTRFVRQDRYMHMINRLNMSPALLRTRHIFPVHPHFRIVTIAAPPNPSDSWLNNETIHLFDFHSVPQFDLTLPLAPSHISVLDSPPQPIPQVPAPASKSSSNSLVHFLHTITPDTSLEVLERLQVFAERMRMLCSDPVIQLDDPLSVRQLIRIARRARCYPAEVSMNIVNICMLNFMPVAKRQAIQQVMKESGLEVTVMPPPPLSIVVDHATNTLTIGDTVAKIRASAHPELIPDVLFYDIPMHKYLLQQMLKDYLLGEHMLLLGNQGVGKNKLTDKFLQLLSIEREYIQLHRDTTVQSLLLSPSLEGGIIVYEDSPLVKAMKHGRALVIDEIDKAPTEVVCILKGLLEDGEILMPDGKRYVSRRSDLYSDANVDVDGIVRIHDDFLVIALGNRPGYPFLGNDFFSETGDCFACFAIDNPEQDSEIDLLRQYAPSIDGSILEKLTSAFLDLRVLTEDGTLAYPYSTRELVNVVVHMEKYPDDDISDVLQNVFAFDSFNPEVTKTIYEVFHRYGIFVGKPSERFGKVELAPKTDLPELEILGTLWLPDSMLNETTVRFEHKFTLQPTQVKDGTSTGWHPMEEKVMARGAVFSEELFRFTHLCGTIVACESSPSYFHVLSVNPLEICSYDFSKPKIMISRIDLEKIAIPKSNSPNAPTMKYIGKVNRLFVYLPQFGALLVDPNTSAVYVVAIPPTADGSVPQLSILYSVIMLYFTGYSKLYAIACHEPQFESTGASRALVYMYEGELPSSIRLVQVAATVDNRAMLEDQNGRDFDCVFEGDPFDPTKESFKCVVRPVSAFITHDIKFDHQILSQAVAPKALHSKTLAALNRKHYSNISQPSPLPFVPFAQPSQSYAGVFYGYGHGHSHRSQSSPSSSSPFATIAHFPRISKNSQHFTPAPKPMNRISLWLSKAEEGLNITSYATRVVMEAVNLATNHVRFIPVATKTVSMSMSVSMSRNTSTSDEFATPISPVVFATELHDGTVCLVQKDGHVRVFEVREQVLEAQHTAWMTRRSNRSASHLPHDHRLHPDHEEDHSDDDNDNDASGEGRDGEENSDGGERDESNMGSGVGSGGSGGTGQGGTSGKGKGGSGGQVLADTNFNIKEEDEQLIKKVAKQRNREEDRAGSKLKTEAEKIAQEALAQAKNALVKTLDDRKNRMNLGFEAYDKLYTAVAKEIGQLRVILEGVAAREKERVWVKNQTHGELDDNRLVDGATGEHTIYKMRGNLDPLFGGIQKKPKRLRFVMDVSSSMSKFNGSDRRLDRMAATCVMIMESFHGFSHKYDYSIVGQDGESAVIPFVEWGKPPKDKKDRLQIIEMMYWNATFCTSGDHTLAAAHHAIRNVISEEGDDYFVFILSDANLSFYGINDKTLASVLLVDKRVNTYAIFIAGEKTAASLTRSLPLGHGYVCLDTSKLPKIFKEIFASALVRELGSKL